MFIRPLFLLSLVAILFFGTSISPAQAQTAAAVPAQTSAQAPVSTLDCPICEVDLRTYQGPLSMGEVEGLLRALNDEYHAWAVYSQVISEFGAVRPFTKINTAEATHINALVALFKRYGLPVPTNPWLGVDPGVATVQQACVLGASAEVDNVALYNNLLSSTARTDILTVYRSLQRASQAQHLPAFTRCAR
jgi:hypothetical protein